MFKTTKLTKTNGLNINTTEWTANTDDSLKKYLTLTIDNNSNSSSIQKNDKIFGSNWTFDSFADFSSLKYVYGREKI